MKLTKQHTKLHDEACALINLSRDLTLDERDFVFENFRPGANHNIGKCGIFFTPPEMASTAALMHAGGGRIWDACAGIGVLARQMIDQDSTTHDITEMVCLEINEEFCRIGRRLVPEARWVCGNIFDAELVRSLGFFESAISNPPFGKVPVLNNYCRHKAPAHLMVAEVLLRRCHQGGIMIIPETDHSREDTDRNPGSNYLRFKNNFPDAMITPLPVDCRCFDFHGANPNVAMGKSRNPKRPGQSIHGRRRPSPISARRLNLSCPVLRTVWQYSNPN